MKATVVLSYRAECCVRSHLRWFKVEGKDPQTMGRDMVKRARRSGQDVDDVLVIDETGETHSFDGDQLLKTRARRPKAPKPPIQRPAPMVRGY